jgi:hypothetical protein
MAGRLRATQFSCVRDARVSCHARSSRGGKIASNSAQVLFRQGASTLIGSALARLFHLLQDCR